MGLLQRRQNPNLSIVNNFTDSQGNFDWVVVGLGNPGKQYDQTRHNIGFLAVDHFVKNNEFNPWILKKDLQSEICSSYIVDKKILAVKPQTFMNDSGQAIQKISNFYKLSNQKIIVVYDDFDLPFGSIRSRFGGSSAGHKGIDSIIQEINSPDFNRIKVGIKQENIKNASEVVLKKFNQKEKDNLTLIYNEITVMINELIFGNSTVISSNTLKVF